MISGGSKVAGALLIGLVAIAAAIYFRPTSQPSSTPSYAGYESVVREWMSLSGVKVAKIKHLTGPFYAVRYSGRSKPGKPLCAMVDVSTEYKGDENVYDTFWWTGGAGGKGDKAKSFVCDF